MSDAPRRGRPPTVRPIAPLRMRLRVKMLEGAGGGFILQVAESDAGGHTWWRAVPVVPQAAPDWEDAPGA